MASTSATRAARGRPWSHPARSRPMAKAGLAPQRLGHVQAVPQPVRRIHDLRPGRARPTQIEPQPRCQPPSSSGCSFSTLTWSAGSRRTGAGDGETAWPAGSLARPASSCAHARASAVLAAFNRSSNALVEAYTMAMTRHVQYRCTHTHFALDKHAPHHRSAHTVREYRISLLA